MNSPPSTPGATDRPPNLTVYADYAVHRPTTLAPAPRLVDDLLAGLAWCRAHGVPRLLADVRGVAQMEHLDTTARFQLGKRAAELAGGKVQVAMVMSPVQIDPERFGETVARNRGLQVDLFTDEVAALTWLVGPNAVRPVLETDRLSLRWLVPADAPFIFELTTQPTWLQNIGDRGVRDLPTAEGYIRNGPLASYAAKGFGLWCVVRKEDGVPVGICGIIKRDTMEDPELAYAFLERFHGQGFGKEAAVATAAYARTELEITKLSAIVNPENVASIKILEKAGLTYRGPIQMPGDPAPISHYTT